MKSFRKGMELLKMLADHEGRISVSLICEKQKIPRSTAYRMLVACCETGMLRADAQNGYYTAGPELFRIGSASLGALDVRRAAFPIMVELSRATTHSIYLMAPTRFEAVCLEKIEGSDGLQLNVNIGARRYMHTSGIAKAFLPFLSEAELEQYLAEPLPSFTDRTVIDADAVRAEVTRMRDLGYGFSDGEYVPGARSLGFPIRDFRNVVVAALGVGGAAERLSDAKLPFIIEQMQQAAAAVSAALGYLNNSSTQMEKAAR